MRLRQALRFTTPILAFILCLNNPSAQQLHTIGWQSYCPVIVQQGASAEITDGFSGDPGLVAERLELQFDHSHSMFAYQAGDRTYARDLVSGLSWDIASGAGPEPYSETRCAPFRNMGTVFTDDGVSVTACREICKSIEVVAGTWVYAYAAAGSHVVAITNYGDALLYSANQWCRMRLSNGSFSCPSAGVEPMVQTPRAIQFYSSLQIQGHTILGQWPTGGIYLFDGDQVRPIANQPPFVTGEPIGYEAQSLAELCGDLYVGYWPTGDIWSLSSGKWTLAASLFTPPVGTDSFIPFYDRQEPVQDQAFYGRRVTALLPLEDGLLAATSNLREWSRDYTTKRMSAEEAEEYGSLYHLTRPNCSS